MLPKHISNSVLFFIWYIQVDVFCCNRLLIIAHVTLSFVSKVSVDRVDVPDVDVPFLVLGVNVICDQSEHLGVSDIGFSDLVCVSARHSHHLAGV